MEALLEKHDEMTEGALHGPEGKLPAPDARYRGGMGTQGLVQARPQGPVVEERPILVLEGLSRHFGPRCPHCQDGEAPLERNVCPRCGTVHALRNVGLELYPGEIVGIVGESGSGKSTLMQCLYFDQEASAGTLHLQSYDGGLQNAFELSSQERLRLRNTMFGMVYQNPYLGLRMDYSSLSNIAEQMISSGNRLVQAMVGRGSSLLDEVNIPQRRKTEAPRRFSGGMQQRVQIAKALSNNPPILLLDEVTTGLDLSVQANVLDLILRIRRDFKVGMLVVSHDLGVVRMLADRTLVMLDGRVIETGLTDQILEDPQHAYTQQLVYSLL
ncbi:MAG: ATP-binding cassette domain-containing protein [Eggerthellaceae bacterium]|jgi:putative phosphonate transport system ATP-binding protein|nr:ATP-binding cassette domain-containing protein [Eggerthellaceae bacterium]MDR2715496.1 ATP-binding cassette domain-containing protein [Coriobacteriaceae bacterium]